MWEKNTLIDTVLTTGDEKALAAGRRNLAEDVPVREPAQKSADSPGRESSTERA